MSNKRINYSKLVPPDTFIGRYLSYCKESETPYAYDFWTAVWLLTSCLGRNVLVARPGAPIFINYFLVLVADSGVTRKSTAVRRAVKLYRKVACGTARLIESRVTQEMLEFQLTQDAIEHDSSQATIAIDELVKFLGREKYVSTMPTLLTDLYDCPDIRLGGGTLARGSSVLKNVFISFLSASTPSWLLRAVNPDVIEGGFTSRVIFVVCEDPKQMSPWPEPFDEAIEQQLLEDLKHMQQVGERHGQILISDGAKKVYTNWYRSRPLYRDSFRASFQSREDAHILKLAAVLAINDGCWELQANHIKAAIKIVTETREDGAAIFEGTGANAKVIAGLDKLRDALLAGGMGGLKQSEITKRVKTHLDRDQVIAALDLMHEYGMVQRFEVPNLGAGRPATVWRATNALVDTKALNVVIEKFTA
jgi:hypothetical protein